MKASLSNWRHYVAAAVAALLAANGELHLVPDSTVSVALTVLGALGLYAMSPTKG